MTTVTNYCSLTRGHIGPHVASLNPTAGGSRALCETPMERTIDPMTGAVSEARPWPADNAVCYRCGHFFADHTYGRGGSCLECDRCEHFIDMKAEMDTVQSQLDALKIDSNTAVAILMLDIARHENPRKRAGELVARFTNDAMSIVNEAEANGG